MSFVPDFAPPNGLPGARYSFSNTGTERVTDGTFVVLDAAHPVAMTRYSARTVLPAMRPLEGSRATGGLGVAVTPTEPGKDGTVQMTGIASVPCHGDIAPGDAVAICTLNARVGHARRAVSGDEVIGQALSGPLEGKRVIVRLTVPWVKP